MKQPIKYILFTCLTLIILDVHAQSEYGETYEEELEYYEEPTDSDYYYGDYGEDSESQEEITTESPSRSSYPVVQPYPDNSRRNQYPQPPVPTTSNPIRLRRPTVVTTQENFNIRGYEDGWVEENGRRRRQKISTTTRRPTTTRPYRRTRKPRPTTARPVSEESIESEESHEVTERYANNMKGNVESSNDEGEYGNLIHHLGYRKEDRSCPEGWVMDIYGYCRERFLMERRDWDWWWNIRDFYFGRMDSGYQSSYK